MTALRILLINKSPHQPCLFQRSKSNIIDDVPEGETTGSRYTISRSRIGICFPHGRTDVETPQRPGWSHKDIGVLHDMLSFLGADLIMKYRGQTTLVLSINMRQFSYEHDCVGKKWQKESQGH